MTTKAAAHFVDADIAGSTSGSPTWQDNRYETSSGSATGISTIQELQDIQDDVINGGDNLTGGDPNYNLGNYQLSNNITIPASFDWSAWNKGPLETSFGGTFNGNFFTITFEPREIGDGYNADNDMLIGDVTTRNNGTQPVIKNLHFRFAHVYVGDGQLSFWSPFIKGIVVKTPGDPVPLIEQISIIGSLEITTDVTTGGVSSFYGLQGGGNVIMKRCWSDVDYIFSLADGAQRLTGYGGIGTVMSFNSAVIEDCYVKATFTKTNGGTFTWAGGSNNNGGFVYQTTTNVSIENCYSATDLADTLNKLAFNGFVALDSGQTFISCYWDETISVTTDGADSGIPAGLTTTEAYAEASYIDWDFDTIWEIDEGNDYPTLQWVNQGRVITGTQDRTISYPQDWTHLEGEEVQVLGDGSYLGTDTVSSGEIDLDDDTTVNHVGLRYASKLQPMKLDGEGFIKRIRHIILNVFESLGGDYGREADDLKTNVLRTSGDVMDTDAALHTGLVELPFPGTNDRQGDIWLTQDEPLPMSVLGIGVKYSQEDK